MAESAASSTAEVSKDNTVLESIAKRMLTMDQQEEGSEQKSRWAFESTEDTLAFVAKMQNPNTNKMSKIIM